MTTEPGISFICCTPRPDEVDRLEKSIDAAIGGRVEHELVIVDNSRKEFDLFSAYARGADQAAYDILGFVHDDVELLSNPSWLERFQALMAKADTGLIGVAGSRKLTSSGRWWEPGNQLSGAVLHTDGAREWMTAFGPCGEVAIVDGVLFFIKKEVFRAAGGYADSNLSGWHFYDIDLSTRVHWSGYKNYTISLIIKHSSIGETNDGWDKNRRAWLAANLGKLPILVP